MARYMPYLRDFARRRNLDLSCTLQYKDSATSSRGLPKLFILTGQDGIFKARICVSPKEAGRIWNNTRYALERAIPTSVPIELEGPIVLLKYIEGEPLMDLDEIKLRDIATIHSNINRFVQLNYSGDLAKKIRGLARVSFQFLG